MTFLREETQRRGFPTADGVHMGPCEVYRRHSHTIGPDGSLYACPGFTGEFALAVGHIDGRRGAPITPRPRAASSAWRRGASAATARSSRCAAAAARWRPMPSLATWMRRHVTSGVFESALVSLAEEAARDQAGGVQ